MSLDPHRLPTTVRPSHYGLTLSPDLDADRFTGTVSITAHVETETESVVLNADELTIDSATITPSATGAATACEVQVDEANERITLIPDAAIAAGDISVDISFSGRFNTQLVGFYLSTFDDADGTERRLATTQFEATHARKCFPCWDEPAFKATFQVSLIVDPAHDAIANSAEVARSTTDDGRTRIEFATTMLMSTYLVAFAIGPLEFSETVDVDGTPLRIVHVPGKGDLTAFALEVGAFALRYFTEYFDVPYPGDKLDLVAIPDFGFGAMENLGCVTFREVLLLIDPTSATQAELQRAADVINHELAHMWFGDLVTMAWWNGLWLNEAFATFMEMKCTDAYRPDWKRWVDFSLSRSGALDTDALASTRPIEFEVVSPEDAEGMFDVLTYEKGAAVVRMLEQYLGEDAFRGGIRRYIKQHQFANAETTDLWDAIEADTGEPVRRIMDSWIFQGSFPLVSTSGNGPTVSFAQERINYAGGADPLDATWAVPLRYRWRDADSDEPASGRVLVDDRSVEVTLGGEVDWLVANASATGFLRVAYTDDQLDRLADVAIDELEPAERYAMIDDAYASVLADRTSSMAFLNLIEAMSGESDRSVWQRLIGGLNKLDRLVDGEARERLQGIAHDVLAPPLANLGLAPREDDDDRARQFRGDLVRALGTTANDPEIQEEAKRTVAMGRRNPQLIDPALMAASVDVVAGVGDDADFDDFVGSWRSAATPQEEIRYLYALGEFSDPALIGRVHAMVLDDQIRSQNAPYLLGRLLASRHGGQATWDFITEHWDRLNERFATAAIVRMLAGITNLDRPQQAAATAAFFEEHTVRSGAQTLAQLLEKQRVNVALRQRESDRLSAFLTAIS